MIKNKIMQIIEKTGVFIFGIMMLAVAAAIIYLTLTEYIFITLNPSTPAMITVDQLDKGHFPYFISMMTGKIDYNDCRVIVEMGIINNRYYKRGKAYLYVFRDESSDKGIYILTKYEPADLMKKYSPGKIHKLAGVWEKWGHTFDLEKDLRTIDNSKMMKDAGWYKNFNNETNVMQDIKKMGRVMSRMPLSSGYLNIDYKENYKNPGDYLWGLFFTGVSGIFIYLIVFILYKTISLKFSKDQ